MAKEQAKKEPETFPPAEPEKPAPPSNGQPRPPAPPKNSLDIQLLSRIDRMLMKRPLHVRVATVNFLKQSYDAQAAEQPT